MTLTNVVWLLAGCVATNAVLAVAWAWWRRPRKVEVVNAPEVAQDIAQALDRPGEPSVRVSDLPEIRRGLRGDIERARRDNGRDRGEPA